jgi:hypothetical protein
MTKIGTLINNDHCIAISIIDIRIFVLKIASTNKGKKGITPSNILKTNTNLFIILSLSKQIIS